MNIHSGSVESKEDWINDFNNMDRESWFGMPEDDCAGLDPFDCEHLVEVVKTETEEDREEYGDWKEV